jgi:HEXXH motif-containing protein
MSTAWSGTPPAVPARVGAREYAVAHHVVAIMREGASSRDIGLMRQAGQLWAMLAGRDCAPATHPTDRDGAIAGHATDIIAVRHSNALPLAQLNSDMPVWAITADAMAQTSTETRWVRPAVEAASRSGYGWLTGQSLSIVVSLHARRLDEATSSWTVSTLPCTIYTDYYPAPALMGKDLVHEAAHSWLNDCLTATHDRLAGEAEYWSPWKHRNRTPFGIVHSAFAFSCVVNFLTWLAGLTTEEALVGYCERRLPAERGRLTEARAGIERALKLTRDGRVRQMVEAELALAVDGVAA